MILPLALRDAARFAGRWNTLWTSHWTVSLPQALIIAGLSWLIALACFLGLVLWAAAISKGWAHPECSRRVAETATAVERPLRPARCLPSWSCS
ncbi:Hypothetical Protein RSKD131_4266 [Cereibacter sphaeroides KD131]|nr:Hypothetical Protein RSKD131_4266 [Cereibacter sphaeroides KD131]